MTMTRWITRVCYFHGPQKKVQCVQIHAHAHIHLCVCSLCWERITVHLCVLYAGVCIYTTLSRVLLILMSNSTVWSDLVFPPFFMLQYYMCTLACFPCVCVYVTVTAVMDRTPCRAFCHVEKGNADSERDSEEDWRGNLHTDNYAVLHLLHLTSTRCRLKSFLSLNRKYLLRSNDV